MQIATTNDDPSGSPTFTDFQNFRIGNYYGRAFKFKLLVTSGDITHQVFISLPSATLETFAKIDTQQLTSSTSALSVSYGTPFFSCT